MAKQKIQKTAIAFAAFRHGKKSSSKKNTSLKQGASSGRARVTGGNGKLPYSVLPVSTVALPPGQGPPMPSTPKSGGRSASTSSAISALRGGASSSGRARKKRGARKK